MGVNELALLAPGLVFLAVPYLMSLSLQPTEGRWVRLGAAAAALGGTALVGTSRHFLPWLAGLELLSLAGCVLVTQPRLCRRKAEAAWKYLQFHALGTACLAAGLALLHNCFGTLDWEGLRGFADGAGRTCPLLVTGLVLLLAGLAQRVGLFPFHAWSPDVHEGSPTGGAFVEGGLRLVPLAALVQVFLGPLFPLRELWTTPAAAIGLGGWLVGALGALAPTDSRRIVAYLGQAQGAIPWLLLHACGRNGDTDAAFPFCFMLTGLLQVGLRGVAAIVERHAGDGDLYHFSGLGFTHPVFSLWIFLLCLAGAGLPPTAGVGVPLVVYRVLNTSGWNPLSLPVALGTVAVAYGYLRFVGYAYLKESREPLNIHHGNRMAVACVCACGAWVVLLLFAFRHPL